MKFAIDAALNMIFNDVRLEYSGNDLIYVGFHKQNKASTSSTEWNILKLSWTGNDLTRVQKLIGSWDNRAILSW